ncbi:hypothetical protein ABBQ32_14156 [Trebouxia sp. C0010 RCD-2024]
MTFRYTCSPASGECGCHDIKQVSGFQRVHRGTVPSYRAYWSCVWHMPCLVSGIMLHPRPPLSVLARSQTALRSI